jgi:hypothetical protein
MSTIKVDEIKNKELKNKFADAYRKMAYSNEADPLFFKMQRGEVTTEEWQAKIQEIKARYPKI